MEFIGIILDTNFFFIPIDFKIDIFEEFDRIIQTNYKIMTFPAIIEELKKLSAKKTSVSWKKRIQMALKIAEKCEIYDESTLQKENIDDFILRIAKEKKWIVATNDKELKKRLKSQGIPIIYLRQKSYLMLEGSTF
ncbi:MAG: nucleotide-binding protein [Candidatus Helarchaeota archaeon]|nr:nucleotide-binding protein [Candidatus Helarchaeota archaeon]